MMVNLVGADVEICVGEIGLYQVGCRDQALQVHLGWILDVYYIPIFLVYTQAAYETFFPLVM